ncbi:hypothetical protein T492DRAFT_935838 [Pavlovales sp. CCMP2436]|nr:hypothetical protein T492DRAFT_935838 [Pavlovales sp. CCMP2436]|mmetsp:Transcript_16996/g.43525  ORF Transcript_16996/g.43525 Transcript_16996/m.43525 type:complete len:205 (+) Transcript_16996:48-662(+)
MLRQLRRFRHADARPLAEDLARKIAHELRASESALKSVEQLGVERVGTVALAKYAFSRALIQSQNAGCSLYTLAPAAQTASGLAEPDERLIRAVAALEEAAASKDGQMKQGSGRGLTAANKSNRTFLASFLSDVVLNGEGGPAGAPALLSRWRSESGKALSESTSALTELKDLRAHLLARLELDRQQRELDVRSKLRAARADKE